MIDINKKYVKSLTIEVVGWLQTESDRRDKVGSNIWFVLKKEDNNNETDKQKKYWNLWHTINVRIFARGRGQLCWASVFDSAELQTQHSAAVAEQQVSSMSGGWNIISSYIEPEDTALSTLLAPIADAHVLVKNDEGEVYWPSLGADTILNWDASNGYKVYLSGPATLTITGTAIDSMSNPIDLPQGWSLVAYHDNTERPIEEALSTIWDSLVMVKNCQGEVFWEARYIAC